MDVFIRSHLKQEVVSNCLYDEDNYEIWFYPFNQPNLRFELTKRVGINREFIEGSENLDVILDELASRLS